MSPKDPFDQLFPPSALNGVLPGHCKRPDQSDRQDEGADSSHQGPPSPEEEIWSVSELINRLNLMLDVEFSYIKVAGELSGIKVPPSGHAYFTLKDEAAQLAAVLFRGRAASYLDLLKEGSMLLCTGSLNVYRARGSLQLIVDSVKPFGEGALKAAFEALKKRLFDEGLFDDRHKRAIPYPPRRIFLITSPSGAAVRDFIKSAGARFCTPEIILCPSTVQGDEAPAQLIAALDLAESMSGEEDVIVITRGGGSMEDLWAFNDEALARRIFACRVPVISAVGHEIDFTISDFVADARAATPTAAAHLVLPSRLELKSELDGLKVRAEAAVAALIGEKKRRLAHLTARLRHPRHTLTEGRLRLDELSGRLFSNMIALLSDKGARLQRAGSLLEINSPAHDIHRLRHRLQDLRHRLEAGITSAMHERAMAFSSLAARLQAASPLACLERGFCLVTKMEGGKDTGRVLRDARQTEVGEELKIRPRRGTVICSVKEIIDTEAKT